MIVEQIQIGNKALQFIDKRIQDVNYRGAASSEHNRYDMNEIHTIVSLLNKYAPNKRLLQIRDTDLSKRPYNYPEEYDYARFCDDVKNTVEKKKGTQDSIRKNIFLDLHRMGFINRYNAKGKIISAYEVCHHIKYVSLTDFGIRFANETNILNQSYMFGRALDSLLGGYLEILLNIFNDPDNDIEKITKYEYMFFVTAINCRCSYEISQETCVTLINEFRKLSPTQTQGVYQTLAKKLNPKLFSGNKTDKRDWSNWKNKADQVFSLFNQTAYFDLFGEYIKLKHKTFETEDGTTETKMRRSMQAKIDYFKQHRVSKTSGFELHHVLPLSWAENPVQLKLFDDWKNLVYIDAYSHAQITHNNNGNIIMSAKNTDIILSDYTGNEVELKHNINIKYDYALQTQMIDYNTKLVETVS